MAQLMKQTLVFGLGAGGLATLTQVASADTDAKSMTLEEVRAENSKRIAKYESEKREIDERNRVKRAQYRDAYAHYAEFADRGAKEPQEPEYEALPILELLEEPIELPFNLADVTPRESALSEDKDDKVGDINNNETRGTSVTEVEAVDTELPEVLETGTKEETNGSIDNNLISEPNGVVKKDDSTTLETKETVTKESTTPESKETSKKYDPTVPETKETGEKASPNTKESGQKDDSTASESKETGEKTSSDAVAAQLNGEKTSSDAVAAQLNKESEKTITSSADAASQVSKIESEKASSTTKSESPTETTSSTDASSQVAKLESEKVTTTKSEAPVATLTKSNSDKTDTNATKTGEVEKTNANSNTPSRNVVNSTAKSDKSESANKNKTQDSLPHTGDSGSLMSLMGLALSGLGGINLRRKRK